MEFSTHSDVRLKQVVGIYPTTLGDRSAGSKEETGSYEERFVGTGAEEVSRGVGSVGDNFLGCLVVDFPKALRWSLVCEGNVQPTLHPC